MRKIILPILIVLIFAGSVFSQLTAFNRDDAQTTWDNLNSQTATVGSISYSVDRQYIDTDGVHKLLVCFDGSYTWDSIVYPVNMCQIFLDTVLKTEIESNITSQVTIEALKRENHIQVDYDVDRDDLPTTRTNIR